MTTRDIVHIALFASLMAVLGAFPPLMIATIGVPITAQSMGPMLAGGILGAKRGALSIVLFLVLVAVGLPLLAGGHGGLAVFAGATGGFIFGWVVAAFVIGFLCERFFSKLNFVSSFAFCVLGGIVVLYGLGMPWVTAVTGTPLDKVALGSLAFIPGDLIKAGIAAAVIATVKRAYPLMAPARSASRP